MAEPKAPLLAVGRKSFYPDPINLRRSSDCLRDYGDRPPTEIPAITAIVIQVPHARQPVSAKTSGSAVKSEGMSRSSSSAGSLPFRIASNSVANKSRSSM